MQAVKQSTPVILFVYNRPDHTGRILKSLNRLKEVKSTKLYIFSDQAKDEKVKVKVDEVRELINRFAECESKFAEVEIRKAERNRGLADSIIKGVTEIIRKYGKVIVLEDDLELSEDFLCYMNRALDFYEGDQNIWSISGYTFPMKALENYEYDVYVSGRGCSWGWATWKDRWETVDWEVRDYPNFKFNFKHRHEFAAWGCDLPEMLDAYMYGEIKSWAIRWCYEAFKQGKLTVYPAKSRVINGGTDGSGTNFQASETRYETQLVDENCNCRFVKCEVNEAIRKEFSHRYTSWQEYIKLKVRWFLIKIGLVRPNH